MTERGGGLPRRERPVTLGERAQILRRCRYALNTAEFYPAVTAALHDAADGEGSGWPRIRDSTPAGLVRLARALAWLGVPESLPRNAAAPPRRRS
jgi:hypothetical protein